MGMDAPSDSITPNGSERTYFKPGNKAAVGHRGPGFLAIRRAAIREYLSTELAMQILDANAVKALDGDATASKFVFDYCGEKPIDKTEMSVRESGPMTAEELQQALDDASAAFDNR
jgi:hypothetical protein